MDAAEGAGVRDSFAAARSGAPTTQNISLFPGSHHNASQDKQEDCDLSVYPGGEAPEQADAVQAPSNSVFLKEAISGFNSQRSIIDKIKHF